MGGGRLATSLDCIGLHQGGGAQLLTDRGADSWIVIAVVAGWLVGAVSQPAWHLTGCQEVSLG